MKWLTAMVAGLMLCGTMIPVQADPDDRQDRRQERGRSDERQDKRDCRQEEGIVGEDKRECKQEEVRDGVRGNQGERLDGDDDDVKAY
jgi:hypothetical protein